MASVFTFESEPLRLSSPWGTVPTWPRGSNPSRSGLGGRMPQPSRPRTLAGLVTPPLQTLADCEVSQLEMEPQEGSTEYKLHLLLRPRRSFVSTSTGETIAGSQRGRAIRLPPESSIVSEPVKPFRPSPASPQPTAQLRQNRLQHLTTQLLWRLQQSSPYHSSSAVSLVIPRLPEATPRLGVPLRPAKLIPGLESSLGALYEIGVADDGSFLGLTVDEMDESLTNLRAMAASLGCNVDILRLVVVGECELQNGDIVNEGSWNGLHKEFLYVVEALVLPESNPNLRDENQHEVVITAPSQSSATSPVLQRIAQPAQHAATSTRQLRVSLTGRTTAGKSSLIGTISTSTLDNGRGKSRLSLLKHRHEIATGVTSSVAPELIGYSRFDQGEDYGDAIINYSCGNISSWNDVHNAVGDGRLILLTDSAGHPRYRRTIVRGLVSWAPHWTLCCIPADENLHVRPPSVDGVDGEDVARSSLAHLGLCLKLQLHLIVVITKQDRATKDNLRHCLSVVLTMIKGSGQRPNLMIRPGTKVHGPNDISVADTEAATKAFGEIGVVPIILTSAVSGNGIGQLHALLRAAPIPALPPMKTDTDTPAVLFHIDDIYTLSHLVGGDGSDAGRVPGVVSGYLRYGQLSVGDHILLGPFAMEAPREASKHAPSISRTRSIPSKLSSSSSPWLSRSMPQSEIGNIVSSAPSTPMPTPLHGEFYPARVVSIRNLRLPLMTLLQDQVATVGIELDTPNQLLISKLRKGMILAQSSHVTSISPPDSAPILRAKVGIQVRFNEEDYEIMEPGAIFNVYVASVRAVAKILTVEAVSRDSFNPFIDANADSPGVRMTSITTEMRPGDGATTNDAFDDLDEGFHDLELMNDDEFGGGRRMIDVVFSFLYNPEWIEIGARVLAMPGQAIAGGVGLDGFVGYVIETRE